MIQDADSGILTPSSVVSGSLINRSGLMTYVLKKIFMYIVSKEPQSSCF